MKPPKYSNLPARFWSKVEVQDSGCWEWQAMTRRGYGMFWYGAKTHNAHRLAAADFYGPIPETAQALHHCDNPPCVNHEHLYYGSRQDNMIDMVRRGRHSGKLTEDAVLSIRDDYANGLHTQHRLAEIHGVDQSNISRIILRQRWGHL